LLESLEVYDRNQDGTVTALEAHDYASQKTFGYSKGTQRPTFEGQFIGSLAIPLWGKKRKDGLPVLTAYDHEFTDYRLSVDKGPDSPLPLAFPLNPKGSQIDVYNPDRQKIATYELMMRPGQEATLTDLLAQPPWSVSLRYGLAQWLSNDIETCARFINCRSPLGQPHGY
jgi:hypothetical protein